MLKLIIDKMDRKHLPSWTGAPPQEAMAQLYSLIGLASNVSAEGEVGPVHRDRHLDPRKRPTVKVRPHGAVLDAAWDSVITWPTTSSRVANSPCKSIKLLIVFDFFFFL